MNCNRNGNAYVARLDSIFYPQKPRSILANGLIRGEASGSRVGLGWEDVSVSGNKDKLRNVIYEHADGENYVSNKLPAARKARWTRMQVNFLLRSI